MRRFARFAHLRGLQINFELDIEAQRPEEARRLAAEAADKLLSNPVIESYRIEIADEVTA